MSDTNTPLRCKCGHQYGHHLPESQGGNCIMLVDGADCGCAGFEPASSLPEAALSPLGGLQPELAARCTAAEAALLDFDRESRAYVSGTDTPVPDWVAWAFRFSSQLGGIVKILRDSA